ncbi:hypothetical protein VIGAN_03182400, partial [Vigna angularis var. angularis]
SEITTNQTHLIHQPHVPPTHRHRSPTNQLPNTLGTQNPFRNLNPRIPKGNQFSLEKPTHFSLATTKQSAIFHTAYSSCSFRL